MQKHKIFVADAIADEGVAWLREQPDMDVDFATGLDAAAVKERLRGAAALVVRSAVKVTADMLGGADALRVIGRAGIGVDNIDVEAATERGIVVLNTPDANATTTAELAVAHIMSLSRHLPGADASVRAGEWKRNAYVGSEITGKTVGIVGYGNIGRIVASRCQGLKMHVVAHDPFVTAEVFEDDGVTPLALDDLLAQSDYVTIHCPFNDKTRGLLDAARLAKMKRGARLVNCARGGIVDEEALRQAVESGHLAGAALDVFVNEPPKGSPLLGVKNIAFTPHLGASTAEAQVAVGVEIARQIAVFLRSGEAINAVNLPRISSEALKRLQPYQALATRLGKLLGLMLAGPIDRVELTLHGRAAELDSHPIAAHALVGLLQGRLSLPVNPVNALHVARRQGVTLTESRSAQTREYLTMVRLTGHGGGDSVTLAGTLFDERHPRLVLINDYALEAFLEGNLLLTRHADRPGVVGALGQILGEENVNIARMQLGVVSGSDKAIAVLEISAPLPERVIQRIAAIPAVTKVGQITL